MPTLKNIFYTPPTYPFSGTDAQSRALDECRFEPIHGAPVAFLRRFIQKPLVDRLTLEAVKEVRE